MKVPFIISMLIASLALAGSAIAPPVPYPIGIKVVNEYGQDVAAKQIELCDIAKNICRTYTTDGYGEITLEAENDYPTFSVDDVFRAQIIGCGDSSCVKTDTLMKGYILFRFVLQTGYVEPEPTTPTCPAQEKCVINRALDFGQGVDEHTNVCDVTVTAPVKPEEKICPTVPTDWTAFITAGGVGAFMLFLAAMFSARRGKVRIQTYERYIKSDGTVGYRWKTRFARAD